MPIRSMTGFGLAEGLTASGTYRIEIRSVNNRFLEMQIRQPRFVVSLEQRIRKELSKVVSRGSIQVNIFCEREDDSINITWDKNLVANYINVFKEISATHSLSDEVAIADLLKLGDIIKTENVAFTEEEVWEHFTPLFSSAISVFQKSREGEGAFIIKELKEMLDEIAATLGAIEERASDRVTEYAGTLKARVQKLIDDPPDPQRMATEIALCADRLDISEECTRLRAHIARFNDDFNAKGPIGKRMGFLLQEMNREANTIGSKANDTEIAHHSVALKENIEKIREQIQNIE